MIHSLIVILTGIVVVLGIELLREVFFKKKFNRDLKRSLDYQTVLKEEMKKYMQEQEKKIIAVVTLTENLKKIPAATEFKEMMHQKYLRPGETMRDAVKRVSDGTL